MTKSSKTLVFFGSGSLAAQCLDLLVKNFDLETVITKPNIDCRPGFSTVEKVATKNNIKLLFANNSQQLDELFIKWQPVSLAGLIIDCGIVISQSVLNNFELGIINSHFSLLPEWRGPDPITYALLSGQTETGVNLMKVAPKIDQGEILGQQKVQIYISDNNQSLSDRLVAANDRLLINNLPKYLNGNVIPTPQNDLPITYSRKIDKNDGYIDWNRPASVTAREIRAFSAWPGSYTNFGNLRIIIREAAATDDNLRPGEWLITPEKQIIVGCRVGALRILSVQPINKKPMAPKDFLNGYKNCLSDTPS
jgi:methionyl-tRNA formyltransferase